MPAAFPPQPRHAMTQQPSPESIFEQVLQCTGADERTVCLDEACGGNQELRREVESPLAALKIVKLGMDTNKV